MFYIHTIPVGSYGYNEAVGAQPNKDIEMNDGVSVPQTSVVYGQEGYNAAYPEGVISGSAFGKSGDNSDED
eukprot:394676-Hanusia_phi.AAC.1